jgi:hypothetical protein
MTATTKTADLLIEGATVITMDVERRIFSDGAIAIGGGRIGLPPGTWCRNGASPELGFPTFNWTDLRGAGQPNN